MHFTKLRLSGFKSFVDPTELLIEPGLTGIVGPNGCGKSNLVEALQWVMGETSARRLRGGDMDDVIFGGTSSRPARNIASVSLLLDNTARTAPDQLNHDDELEVDRRIDRGKGSTYRVNGQELRARDVQLLFADAASGAQSPALIGQGRIGWLINAKPAERRVLLEEAAGTSGLQARRHEAELRLSAAETNLARLSDIAATLEAQAERLKKQSRQAERYRKLADQLRRAEALVLYRHWLDQNERVKRAAERLALAERRAGNIATALAAADQASRLAHEALPELRDRAAATAQIVERLAGALMALDAEERRVAVALEEGQRRLVQLDQDIVREQRLGADAAAALDRLAAERAGLDADRANDAATRAAAAGALLAARVAVAETEARLNEATTGAATGRAARDAIQRRLHGIGERRLRLDRQLAESVARGRELDLLAVPAERLAAAEAEIAAAEQALTDARDAAEAAEQALKDAERTRQVAREPVQTAERRALQLRAEIDALRSVTSAGLAKGFAPILEDITVRPGLEAALGAAFGDDLLASRDPGAAIRWVDLPDEAGPIEPLPAGAEAIAPGIDAPAALRRRLARIGIVADVATGERLQPLLRPGQVLVTEAGAVWRWDGLTTTAGAPTAAATRLAQRNRLRSLEGQLKAADAGAAEAQEAERLAAAALDQAQRHDREARAAQLQAAQRSASLRQAQLALAQQHSQAQARQQAALETAERLTGELAELAQQTTEAEHEMAALPDPAAQLREVDRLRGEFATRRETETLHQREADRLARDAAQRQGRIAAIDGETLSWRGRDASAAQQAAALGERRTALAAEIAATAIRPAELATERLQVTADLAVARDRAQNATAALKDAETAAAAAEQAQAAAAQLNGEAREDRVRAEAAHEQAVEARQAASSRARENFDCPSEHLPRVAGIPAEPAGDDLADLEMRLDRLRRERDSIGPVNLMADTELAEIAAELETIRTESADLVAAIAKLRLAIQQLNREGGERLAKAFEAVNAHFQQLFVRLFGGGQAYLELTRQDGDPLAAGIEIMASPPGKKMQALSLLSGGERALTALALVFAVFLTNPAPVCVLDEVDAPLDDANVERFCNLVREIGERTGTRFLIVTHHRVSMARMDRLYGVTMTERGVSRLVSVELQTAERLRQRA